MNNYIKSKKGREYVKKLLRNKGWIVETVGKKDEYFEIRKNSKSYKVKVKTLSKKTPVAFGTTLDKWKKADFMIICRFLENKEPELFISDINQVITGIDRNPEYSEWLPSKIYERFETDLNILEKECLLQKILGLLRKLRIKS